MNLLDVAATLVAEGVVNASKLIYPALDCATVEETETSHKLP